MSDFFAATEKSEYLFGFGGSLSLFGSAACIQTTAYSSSSV